LGEFCRYKLYKTLFFPVAGICCWGSELISTVIVEDGLPAKEGEWHEGAGFGKIRNDVRFFCA
jgi:hypothetical protein